MAGLNRPATLIAGAEGLCLSVATGVGLGHNTATGMNPLYSEAHYASADGDESNPLDGTVGDSAAVDHFSEAAARSLTSPDFSDRPIVEP